MIKNSYNVTKYFFDFDMMYKETIWHLVSYHPQGKIKISPSGSGFHVWLDFDCSICRMLEDYLHNFIYHETGSQILFLETRRKTAIPFKFKPTPFVLWFPIIEYFRLGGDYN